MSEHRPTQRDRIHELLADRATGGLAPADREELDRLLDLHPDVDRESFDRIVAAIDLPRAWRRIAPMPAGLRRRVETDAIAWLARSRGLSVVSAEPAEPAPAPEPLPVAPPDREPRPAPRIGRPLPWLLAAACLLFAATAWWSRLAPAPALADQFAALTADPASIVGQWQDVGGLGVSGDIVWNNAGQRGVMRFTGLAANDPDRMQYQLWIFDAARRAHSEFDAVDGGVFDIVEGDVEEADGAVYVSITAKLDVFEPALFAITTEPPGGVVKHVDTEEHRIILTAAAGTSS